MDIRPAVKFLLQRQVGSLFGNLNDEAKAHIQAIDQSLAEEPRLDIETGTLEPGQPGVPLVDDDHPLVSK